MSPILIAVIAGIVVGTCVGILGAGGGILSLPALVYLLGQDPHAAAAGSAAIVGATALVSLVPNLGSGNLRWKEGLIYSGVGALGSVAGAQLAPLFDAGLLMISFGILVALVAAWMLIRQRLTERQISLKPQKPRGLAAAVISAAVIGVLAGIFGVGGAFATVPALTLIMGFPMKHATVTSMLVTATNAIMGLAGRVGQELNVDWKIIGAFMIGSIIAGALAARLSTRLSQRTLTYSFISLLGVLSAFTIAQVALGF